MRADAKDKVRADERLADRTHEGLCLSHTNLNERADRGVRELARLIEVTPHEDDSLDERVRHKDVVASPPVEAGDTGGVLVVGLTGKDLE